MKCSEATRVERRRRQRGCREGIGQGWDRPPAQAAGKGEQSANHTTVCHLSAPAAPLGEAAGTMTSLPRSSCLPSWPRSERLSQLLLQLVKC